MIVVTKPGKLPEKRKHEGTCRKCGCWIECEQSDLVELESVLRVVTHGVRCPTEHCKSFIEANPMAETYSR
jgi:hypothetical protein